MKLIDKKREKAQCVPCSWKQTTYGNKTPNIQCPQNCSIIVLLGVARGLAKLALSSQTLEPQLRSEFLEFIETIEKT